MPRRVAFMFLLLAVACGGGPTTPSVPPTPPPPTFPSMAGGWGGTWAAVTVVFLPEGPAPGSVSCNVTWLIGSQTGGSLVGTYQQTGQGCADAGSMSGNVSSGGNVALTFSSNVPSPVVCVRTSGNGVYNGVLSVTTGALTAQTVEGLHCTFGRETFDLNRTATLSMSRR